MIRKAIIILTVLLGTIPLTAQEADTPWQWHLSTGSSVASGFGRTQMLSWVAPSFEIAATSRLTVKGGLMAAGSLLPEGYKPQGYGARNLAPLRNGTSATMLWASAEYRVNERLLVWGSLAHIGGLYQPLWLDQSLPLQATAYSGGFSYALSHKSLLEVHFHIVHDSYGTSTLGLMGYPYHDPLCPSSEPFHGPWPF